MPWRLIVIILIGAAFIGFIGLNLDNRCDISFGFGLDFYQVPVFLTHLTAFVLGMALALPLAVSFRSKLRRGGKEAPRPPAREGASKKEKAGKIPAADTPVLPPSPGGDYGID
jgi:hypothetical protein